MVVENCLKKVENWTFFNKAPENSVEVLGFQQLFNNHVENFLWKLWKSGVECLKHEQCPVENHFRGALSKCRCPIVGFQWRRFGTDDQVWVIFT